MNRSTFAAALLAGFLCSLFLCGQAKMYAAAGEAPLSAGDRPAARQAALERARPRSVFAGRVVFVGGDLETFSVKGRGATVTFDASRPVLKGYRSLSDMRIGDVVAVSYLEDGISVARQAGGRPEPPGAGTEKVRRGGAHGLLRRAPSGNDGTFDDADANKDGRVTPVELSTVIPDVTLDRFRQYDANSDGYLDRAEFAQALKARRTQKAR